MKRTANILNKIWRPVHILTLMTYICLRYQTREFDLLAISWPIKSFSTSAALSFDAPTDRFHKQTFLHRRNPPPPSPHVLHIYIKFIAMLDRWPILLAPTGALIVMMCQIHCDFFSFHSAIFLSIILSMSSWKDLGDILGISGGFLKISLFPIIGAYI